MQRKEADTGSKREWDNVPGLQKKVDVVQALPYMDIRKGRMPIKQAGDKCNRVGCGGVVIKMNKAKRKEAAKVVRKVPKRGMYCSKCGQLYNVEHR